MSTPVLLSLLAVLLLLTGCATVPDLSPDADPVQLLPHHTELLITLPLSEQRAGIETVAPELFEGDLRPILNRTARMTVGRTPPRIPGGVPTLHLVIEGGFSANSLRFGLPRRHGWSRERVMGVRWYRSGDFGVLLLDDGVLYAVLAEHPESHIRAALLRMMHPAPGGHPLSLPAARDAGRIWWGSSDVLLDGGIGAHIPPQLRSMLDVSGQFDYAISPSGRLLMGGELHARSETSARALNVSLRVLLPQILRTSERPNITRDGTTLRIVNIQMEPDVVRGWVEELLEDFL
ncbi:hypothetical protein [Spirochaeta africana]|uniref:hypothetical protein n=1 Tax=Spirochaeta africana TaxID=46355 RepID=UPI00059E9B27|nr:hypothetical protein [Spirochaeta africana]